MDISAIALQGLNDASAQLEVAATKLAAAASPGGASSDTVSLSEEMVALMSAKTMYSANVSTFKTADHIQKSAVDLMA